MKLLILLTISVTALAVPNQLVYTKGEMHQFNLNGTLDSRGHTVDKTSGGAISSLTSVMVFQCTDVNATAYMFRMNLFNTFVSVDQQDGPAQSQGLGALGDSLGADVYFVWMKNGSIPVAYIQKGDSQFFVNIKLGAISTLQTQVVQPQETVRVLESDPTGVHYSTFVGKTGSSMKTPSGATPALTIQKTYTQNDFHSFSDPNLKSSNMDIQGQAGVMLHDKGYVLGTRQAQVSLLVKGGNGAAKAGGERTPLTEDTYGFDMQFRAAGRFTLDWTNSVNMADAMWFESRPFLTAQQLVLNGATVGSLGELGAHAVQHAQSIAGAIATPEQAQEMDVWMQTPKVSSVKLQKIASAVEGRGGWVALRPCLKRVREGRASQAELRNLFFVLAAAGSKDAQETLVEIGLQQGVDANVQLVAILTAAHIQHPVPLLIKALAHLAKNGHQEALLALGACISRTDDLDLRRLAQQVMMEKMNTNPKVVRLALKNAGMPMDDLEDDDDFPYNVSWSKSAKLGGKVIEATFAGELFAGTNFDCNHPWFNYQALAKATADLSILGINKQAFLGLAQYGRENGAPLADELLLQVFEKVIYQKSIPQLDCSEHTYPLAHTAPGWSFSYVLWVSVVPITFKVGVNLEVDVKWGWNVCDSDLSAMVELVPKGTVTVYGSAELDLLIIKAATELDVSLDTAIVPQVYIHGSECTVGFDVREENDALSANLHSFYQWKHCKYWIFDCHWGSHHDHSWWSWSKPAQNKVIYDKEWKIANSTLEEF